MTDDTACAATYAPLVGEKEQQMTGTSSTPTGVTPAGYVPNFVRNDGPHAEPQPASSTTSDAPDSAPELVTRVLTLEAADEARRVIADARRRLAEIAARASQASLVRHPGETPPVREPGPGLEAIAARRTPPTLRVQPRPAGALRLQDPPRASPGPAGSAGLSREYEWEQAVKAPFQVAPQKGPGGVLESLRSAAFPSPSPMPDKRRSERR